MIDRIKEDIAKKLANADITIIAVAVYGSWIKGGANTGFRFGYIDNFQ